MTTQCNTVNKYDEAYRRNKEFYDKLFNRENRENEHFDQMRKTDDMHSMESMSVEERNAKMIELQQLFEIEGSTQDKEKKQENEVKNKGNGKDNKNGISKQIKIENSIDNQPKKQVKKENIKKEVDRIQINLDDNEIMNSFLVPANKLNTVIYESNDKKKINCTPVQNNKDLNKKLDNIEKKVPTEDQTKVAEEKKTEDNLPDKAQLTKLVGLLN
eukprot:CAMPEP_0116893274 /NCGR_PEP_ID=MMETSP0467-20121206/3304_1 /TAXON_ID=283647 /ORGANISM="Mesodinium pulex, Strain SPMC105" /LENGTH=214 /DNA_ID=CAMNT_0004562853 /DNA_START=2276 /DNA_END=2920 /DNA_ORIENTATION=-